MKKYEKSELVKLFEKLFRQMQESGKLYLPDRRRNDQKN